MIIIIICPAARVSQNMEEEELVTANKEEKSLHPLWVVDMLQLSFLTLGSLSPWLRLQNPSQTAIIKPREMAQQGRSHSPVLLWVMISPEAGRPSWNHQEGCSKWVQCAQSPAIHLP